MRSLRNRTPFSVTLETQLRVVEVTPEQAAKAREDAEAMQRINVEAFESDLENGKHYAHLHHVVLYTQGKPQAYFTSTEEFDRLRHKPLSSQSTAFIVPEPGSAFMIYQK